MSEQAYKTVDLAVVRTQALAELRQELGARQAALLQARFRHRSGQRGKTHLLRLMRRDVARLTQLVATKTPNQRGRTAEPAAAGAKEQ